MIWQNRISALGGTSAPAASSATVETAIRSVWAAICSAHCRSRLGKGPSAASRWRNSSKVSGAAGLVMQLSLEPSKRMR
jgi:anti-sigma-K factor RskA